MTICGTLQFEYLPGQVDGLKGLPADRSKRCKRNWLSLLSETEQTLDVKDLGLGAVRWLRGRQKTRSGDERAQLCVRIAVRTSEENLKFLR